MPNLNQVKKTKPKKTNLPLKSKAPKSSPVEYYNCLLTQAQNDWLDPQTGKKKKITACCRDCKTKAPLLNQVREKELTKLVVAYRQVGDSLSKLLQPLK